MILAIHTFAPHITAILSFGAFYSMDIFIRNYGELLLNKQRNPRLFTRMRNYALSVIHAVTTGCSSLICLLLFDGLLSDVILAQNEGAYHLLGFSTGYFLHDIYHNIRYGHGIRSAEIIVHHIAVIVCFLVVLKYRLLLSYALFGLLMELNSIFLHGRQLLLYFNISPGSKWYQYNLRANILSFVIFRLLLSTGLYIWAFVNRDHLPQEVSMILIFSFTIFTVMNYILFWRVLASERRILECHLTVVSKEISSSCICAKEALAWMPSS